MESKAATIALLAALGIGAVSYSVGAWHIADPAPIIEVKAPDVEVKNEAAPVLLEKIAESAAVGVLSCRKGVIDNMPPETVYCSDGLSAGFVLPAAAGAALLDEKPDVRVFVNSDKLYIAGEP